MFHYYHASTLYENDRHFSHLSGLEREMCFRSEMGLYYSFYKRIINSKSVVVGVLSLKSDNLTEYPETINALSKFNIYPEVLVAGMFRLYQYFLQMFQSSGTECYTVHRGDDWPAVKSCVGLGEPILFYLEVVWIFAGITGFILFCYGAQLSGSLLGGCFTLVSFFINHTESTRVQWTPPLRESFGYPMIVLHCLSVTIILKNSREYFTGNNCKFEESMIVLSTMSSLLFWQFSQFILVCEVAILTVLYVLGTVKKEMFERILFLTTIGLLIALVGLMGNQLLMFSFFTAILMASWLLLAYDVRVTQQPSLGIVLRICGFFVSALAIKSSFPSTGNDTHIIKLFWSKIFEDQDDFHSLMYTCAPEFRSLSWAYVAALTDSLLIPLLIVVLLVFFVSTTTCHLNWFYWLIRRSPEDGKYLKARSEIKQKRKYISPSVEPSHIFNILLLIAFGALAMMAMRLKLFLTPQICVLVSLIASKQVTRIFPILREKPNLKNLCLIFALVALCFYGRDNIRKQYAIEGEYSNYPLEEVLTWIKMRTNKNDVFAGPMPVMASILLSAERPVVNHPYYEDKDMRARTIRAYSVFSRRTSSEAFKAIQSLGANYVVLEAHKCYNHLQPREGCRMTDLWDIEDPGNMKRQALCPKLYDGDASPFSRVFSNSEYAILYLSPENSE